MPHRCVVIIKKKTYLIRKQCQILGIYDKVFIGHTRSSGVAWRSVLSRATSKSCLSGSEHLIGSSWAGPTSAERWLYVGGVATRTGAPFEAIAPKPLAHGSKDGNQSCAGCLERCMGVPNHRQGKSTLLIVWLGHPGVSFVNMFYVSIYVVIIYYYLYVFWFNIFIIFSLYSSWVWIILWIPLILLKPQAVRHFQIK